MKQNLSIKINPSMTMSKPWSTHGSRDAPMTMPSRRPSASSLLSPTKPLTQLVLSSSSFSACPVLYSPDSSFQCLNVYAKDTLRRNVSFHLAESEKMNIFLSTATDFATTGDDKQWGVRFAPSSTTAIVSVMGLGDYTPEEVKACWYSREETKKLRHATKRNLSKTKGNKCPLLTKEARRWTA